MIDEYQKQKAGDNSNQFQVGSMTFNMGIDEKRVREICDETFQVACRDMTIEASKIARNRMEMFEEEFITKFQKVEGALEVLKDPSFQFTLTNAHKIAASTNQESDYEVLSELLIHRVESNDDRIKTTGINRAINIVNQVSSDALLAVTVAFAVESIEVISNNIKDALDGIDSMFEKLCYDKLPNGALWIEHLDILDVVRIDYVNQLKKFEIYYSEIMPDYCSTGIKIDSDNFKKCQMLISENDLPQDILLPHELDSQYVRLPVLNADNLKSVCADHLTVNDNNKVTFYKENLSEKQINILYEIYSLYDCNQDTKDHFKELFYKELLNYPNIRNVLEWWNSIPYSFKITTVGEALAYANAKRYDSTFPTKD